MYDLAAYAANPASSRGRQFNEPPPVGRTEFQRDRDRIVHSTAFRRLEYKTQVFVNHEGDLFRTRLTHSIEVAQIGRSVARNLGLNEDLVEAVSLAHDLGHTPFGHAGQDALNDCMKDHGGFEHNLQSLRVVDVLEQRYAAFDGLNLCFETREGILKHCSVRNAQKLAEIGERFIRKQRPSLEAQIANLPDEIAFNTGIQEEQQELKKFLHKHLYQHYRVARMSNKAKRIVTDLFRAFLSDARLLPPEFQVRAESDLPRAIADYVAGMTDRYAIREHRRLFTVEET